MTFNNKISDIFNLVINFMIFIILFLVFFFIITPISIVYKIFIRDPMKLNYDRNIDSYWVSSSKNNSDMNNQY